MGFYVAPNGRLLVLGFYGICPTALNQPNDGNGIGRVVRELRDDGGMGSIYFIRYNAHAGWDASNTVYPHFTSSADSGFAEACEALLADRLMTLQWWEEDRGEAFFPPEIEGCKALCFYHLPDGRVAGLWKFSRVSVSSDGGHHWDAVRESPSLVMEGGKVWGQRTADDRFALLYTPIKGGRHPLSVVTSDDGLNYDDLLTVNPDTSRMRYVGLHKGPGQHYPRGIVEGNGTPPGRYLWVTYSMNKEDIWVSRIPVPVESVESSAVDDDFGADHTDQILGKWNITSLKWSEVSVSGDQGSTERYLKIAANDPLDHAKAERVFPESECVRIECEVKISSECTASLYVEVLAADGEAPVSVVVRGDGTLEIGSSRMWQPIGALPTSTWVHLRFDINLICGQWDLLVDDADVVLQHSLSVNKATVERIAFKTGEPLPVSREPRQSADHATGQWEVYGKDEPSADAPVGDSAFFIRVLRVRSI
jgi:hypothetical protein